jgi:hypothetical protein
MSRSRLLNPGFWLVAAVLSVTPDAHGLSGDDYAATVNALHPIAYWRLSDTGAVAADAVGLVDGAYTNSPATGQTSFLTGDTCVNFDGSNDYVAIAHNDAFLLDAGTISLWFKADTTSSRRELFSKDSTGYDTGGHVTINVESNKINVRMQSTSASKTLQSSTISSGQWIHVAFTFGANGMELYIDGQLVDTDAYTGGTGTTSGGVGNYEPIAIGANTYSSDNFALTPLQNYFDGCIDEVAIFGSQLGASDVADLADKVFIFVDVTSSTGFGAQTTTSNNAGWHWGDVDGDGDLDAISTGNQAKLFLNSNEGTSFFATTFGGGVLIRQGALLDVDNDGDLDFWGLPSYTSERLLVNDGAGSFASLASAGFNNANNNEGVAAADTDADGWCDVLFFSENGNWIGFNQQSETPSFSGSVDSGYGLNDSGDYGNGDFCSSGDVNNDGHLDFFYHYGNGKLFLSEGDGTYIQANGGISVLTGNSDKMGSAWGDYDNDGDLDLFVCRYDSGQRGYLWRNSGGAFTNVALSAGITNTGDQLSCCWGDYDNDGDLDLYVTTLDDGNILYGNNGDGTFTEVSSSVSIIDDCHDAVFVDYDNDGDLDMSVLIEDANNRLFRNLTDDTNYLKVRVIGLGDGGTNAAGVGVRIDLYDSSGETFLQRRDVGVARGFAGSEPLWAHFGGVNPSSTYTVKVHFVTGTAEVRVSPSTATTTIGATTIGQMITIEEGAQTDYRITQWLETRPVDP